MLLSLFRRWSLDLRALALLRMCYGFLLLLDVAIRSSDLTAHYTDMGVAPRQLVLEKDWFPEYFSFHMMNGSFVFQGLLMLVTAALAICLAVGYRTRLAGFGCWLMVLSLHTRNGMVLDGGDTYFRCMLFWCQFLPWGARWSLDARRWSSLDPPPKTYFHAGTLAYMAQICLLYQISILHKTGDAWRHSFTAVHDALMLQQLSTSLAPGMLAHPELMKFLTRLVFRFEELGPCLFWLGPLPRGLAAVGVTLMHIGFGSFLHLGVFALIGMASPVGLWPSAWMDRIEGSRPFAWLRGWLERHLPLAPAQEPRPTLALGQGWNTVLVGLLAYVVCWNLNNVRMLPFPLNLSLGRVLRLDQQWNMFAPRPLEQDGYYVIDAEQVNGHHIDLFRGGRPLDWSKPTDVAATYSNARWRKFMMNIWMADLSDWRLPYGRFLTRSWNGSHSDGEQIRSFRIFFMLETIQPGGDKLPTVKTQIWRHECMPSPVGSG